jgi:hypothetical protein
MTFGNLPFSQPIPCCPFHAKYRVGSSQASNHIDILSHSASQTALSLLQLQPRLLTTGSTGPYWLPVYTASSEIAHRNLISRLLLKSLKSSYKQYSTCQLITDAISSVRHWQLKFFTDKMSQQ